MRRERGFFGFRVTWSLFQNILQAITHIPEYWESDAKLIKMCYVDREKSDTVLGRIGGAALLRGHPKIPVSDHLD